jgi:type VI secretion system protein ImpH
VVSRAGPGETAGIGDSRLVDHIDITPAFMGLLGSGGTLPSFYTELFAEHELLQRDRSARAFLDIFLQRAVVLMYRAWLKHRLPLQFESQRRRHYLPYVLSLTGLGQKSLQNRLAAQRGGVADDTLAFYAATLRQRPVSAIQLQQVLAQYFAVGVKLESFIGRWFELPLNNQSRLGAGKAAGNLTLGGGALVGERVWQRDLRMRLTLGPLTRHKFHRFLPGGAGALALRELLTLMTGLSLEYEVRLSLAAPDVEPAKLHPSEAPLLGWSSFLITRPASQDRCDAGYDIHAAA